MVGTLWSVRRWWVAATLVGLIAILGWAAAQTGIVRAQAAEHFIYDDELHWANWSWGTSIDTGATSPVFEGDNSMLVEYQQGWAAASFFDGSFDTSPFDELRFAIHPGGNPIPDIRVALYDEGGSVITNVDPSDYSEGAGDGWHLISIPLADLGAENTTVSRIHIKEFTGSVQPAFHIDALGFFAEDGAPPPAQPLMIVADPADHGTASPTFAAADPIATLELGEGSWKITASGAMNFARFGTGEGPAPNCGLREDDIMLAKQNLASEADAENIQRGGFSIVGATEGPADVELVCFGGTVFEYNIVAIGGSSAQLQASAGE